MPFEVKLNIPDVWYDFFGRLLPGSIFVAALRHYEFGITSLPKLGDLIVIGMLGYACGLFINPLGGGVLHPLEHFLGVRDKIEELAQSGAPERYVLVCDKIKAEAVFFSQLFFLTVIFSIWAACRFPDDAPWVTLVIVCAGSFLGAMYYIWSRKFHAEHFRRRSKP